jgi:hypothetical protein
MSDTVQSRHLFRSPFNSSFRASKHASEEERFIWRAKVVDIPESVGSRGSACVQHNTSWHRQARLGNADDEALDRVTLEAMTVRLPTALYPNSATLDILLRQTMAYNQSKFLSWREDTDILDTKAVRRWSVRLLYLAAFYHQHHAAIPEARIRLESPDLCRADLEALEIGVMDYECPATNYLVASLPGIGLGANIRGGVVPLLIAGLVANRTVLIENNDWKLASCGRMDYQCFFRAATPCVPTLADLFNATHLNRSESRQLLNGVVPDRPGRVWRMNLLMVPPLARPSSLTAAVHNYASAFIDELRDAFPVDPRLPILTLAAERLLEQEERRDPYNYAAAELRINHALGIFALRPNTQYGAKIDENIKTLTPSNMNPDDAFGLPVRASDKCGRESQCLSFQQHMKAVSYLWPLHLNNSLGSDMDPYVVFTTESTSMVQEQKFFVQNETLQTDFPYRFKFLTNHLDVTPDTGFVRRAAKGRNYTADESMLSAMTSVSEFAQDSSALHFPSRSRPHLCLKCFSGLPAVQLKLQMLPRVTLANCCSNFHILLNDFLMEGLGAAASNDFTCFQELPDPELRICCGWHKDCIASRAAALANLTQAG